MPNRRDRINTKFETRPRNYNISLLAIGGIDNIGASNMKASSSQTASAATAATAAADATAADAIEIEFWGHIAAENVLLSVIHTYILFRMLDNGRV